MANTFAERWIGSIRRELLDRTIIWNQRQLERLVSDYIDHYNQHRPHQSLDQRPPTPVHDHPTLHRRPSPCSEPADATASSTNTKTPPDQPRPSFRAAQGLQPLAHATGAYGSGANGGLTLLAPGCILYHVSSY